MSWLEELRFDRDGLIPVVAQEAATGEVLMLAYATREALEKSLVTGRAHYWSRSRRELWAKGDTSGHVQEVVEVRADCDGDSVLYRVHQSGPACHTGSRSCFFRLVEEGALVDAELPGGVLDRVDRVIADRRKSPEEGSYTNYLFDQGLDKILKKVGEEATEVVIAAKNAGEAELGSEIADLLYHLLVLMRERNLPLRGVWKELDRRFGRAPRPRGHRDDRRSET